MRAWIYTGGPIRADGITAHPGEADLTVAADAGYRNARLLGDRVDILVGDFDSLGPLPDFGEHPPEIHTLPVEKDLTDTETAVDMAVERGADEIVLIGSFSGRLDHTLSSLYLLEDLFLRGIPAVMTDGQSRARFIRNATAQVEGGAFTYFALIAADETVEGVDIDGAKYPLHGATLFRRSQFAVSNEVKGDRATVTVKHGSVFVIESRDAF